MNTNGNTYTIIYTTIVVVLVAAALAYVSQKLSPLQAQNEKAETISQILTAAQFGEKEHWAGIGNAGTVRFFEENAEDASKIWSKSDLKALNYKIKDGSITAGQLPIYAFKNGVTVIPVYGAGLWGPVWGYIALDKDLQTIVGAYFDHESETPGLGAKIKDEAWFREKFAGRKVAFGTDKPFSLAKNAEATGADNAVDAITGATMTSKGLDEALNVWFQAYENYFNKAEEE